MYQYINSIFQRTPITSTKEIIHWWSKGRVLLNLILLLLTIIHLSILWFVFKDGWIFFLLPFILLIWGIVNLLFSAGLIFELVNKKFFKSKVDFNKIASSIKVTKFIILIFIVVLISAWHLLNQ